MSRKVSRRQPSFRGRGEQTNLVRLRSGGASPSLKWTLLGLKGAF